MAKNTITLKKGNVNWFELNKNYCDTLKAWANYITTEARLDSKFNTDKLDINGKIKKLELKRRLLLGDNMDIVPANCVELNVEILAQIETLQGELEALTKAHDDSKDALKQHKSKDYTVAEDKLYEAYCSAVAKLEPDEITVALADFFTQNDVELGKKTADRLLPFVFGVATATKKTKSEGTTFVKAKSKQAFITTLRGVIVQMCASVNALKGEYDVKLIEKMVGKVA